MLEKLNQASLEERRLILRAFIKTIAVERDGNTLRGLITYYYPPGFSPSPLGRGQGEGPKDPSMLPIDSSPVGAHLYRQTFTHPFIYVKPH
jgi:hypothetical protein